MARKALAETGPPREAGAVMTRIRVATFNAENLFTRPDFASNGTRPSDRRVGMVEFKDEDELRIARRISEATLSGIERQLTAQVILDADADFVALQEVDDEAALILFRDEFVHPGFAPRLGRALKAHLDTLWEPLDAQIGPEDGSSERAAARRVWLARALDERRHEIEPTLFYDFLSVVEGNDRRGIDLGYLSRLRPVRVSHYARFTYDDFGLWSAELERILEQDWRNFGAKGRKPDGRERVFRRDVVEVELDVGGRSLTIFNVHLKSNTNGGRDRSFAIRDAEARALATLVRRRFPDPDQGNWLICGDFNDYVEVDGSKRMINLKTAEPYRSTLPALLEPAPRGLGAFDTSSWIADPKERWTCYFPLEDVHSQLDHILISPALRRANEQRPASDRAPRILRKGLSWSVPRAGERYPGVGLYEPKASDHAAMVIDLEVP